MNEAEIHRLRMLARSAEHLQGVANRRVAELQRSRAERLLAGDAYHMVRSLDQEIATHQDMHRTEGHRLALIAARLKELVTPFANAPDETRARLAELKAEQAVLAKMRPTDRSAVDDHRLDVLAGQIHEVEKRVRQLDRMGVAA